MFPACHSAFTWKDVGNARMTFSVTEHVYHVWKWNQAKWISKPIPWGGVNGYLRTTEIEGSFSPLWNRNAFFVQQHWIIFEISVHLVLEQFLLLHYLQKMHDHTVIPKTRIFRLVSMILDSLMHSLSYVHPKISTLFLAYKTSLTHADFKTYCISS